MHALDRPLSFLRTTVERPAALIREAGLQRPLRGLTCAALAAAIAMVSPPGALLVLALLAARALLELRTPSEGGLAVAATAYLIALAIGLSLGLGAMVGVLFVWRLFADARWCAGETKRLAVAAGKPDETRFSAAIPIWLTALFSLSIVAYSAPHAVLGAPLELPQAPLWAPILAGALAVFGIGDWVLRRAADLRLGQFAAAPATHVLGYHMIFLLAYGTSFDLSAGVVAVAAWRLAHAAPNAILSPNLFAGQPRQK